MRYLPGLVLPLLGGCFVLRTASPMLGTDSVSAWYEVTPVLKTVPEILKSSREAIRKAGFAALPPKEDDPNRIETDWVIELSAHWRQGSRSRIELEVAPIEGARGYTVRVREKREVNDNATSPDDATKADWIPATFDEKQKTRTGENALRIQQLLKFRLLENF